MGKMSPRNKKNQKNRPVVSVLKIKRGTKYDMFIILITYQIANAVSIAAFPDTNNLWFAVF
jgi:hypothetical protein